MEENEPAPETRRYLGIRTPLGCTVGFNDDSGDVFPMIDPRFDLRMHSPDGFEWGYHGSGPCQLALALVADATGDDELAKRVYLLFMHRIVSGLVIEGWELSAAEIRLEVESIDRATNT